MKYITLDDLIKWGACAEGVTLFDRLPKDSRGRVPVTHAYWARVRRRRSGQLVRLHWLARNCLTLRQWHRAWRVAGTAYDAAHNTSKSRHKSYRRAITDGDKAYERVLIDHIKRYGKNAVPAK